MDTLLDVAQLLALVSVSALCIYLIVVLARLKDVLSEFQKSVSEFTVYAKPVLENLLFITEKFRSVASKIDEQANIMKGSLESMKLAADNIVAFEQRVQQWLEEPIFRVTSAVSRVVNGLLSWFEGSGTNRPT